MRTPTNIFKIFETNSSFLFSGNFCWYWQSFHFKRRTIGNNSMKFWDFLDIPKVLSFKSFDNSLTLCPNSERILLCHHYYHSFLPVSTIIITFNYMQTNKVCGFFTILQIWGLPTDYMQKWFLLIKARDWLWTFYLKTIEQSPKNIIMIGKH